MNHDIQTTMYEPPHRTLITIDPTSPRPPPLPPSYIWEMKTIAYLPPKTLS